MNDRIAKLEKLLAVEPNDAFVLYSLAQEHGKSASSESVETALRFYDRCIASDENYCYAYYHKAKLLADVDRAPEAVAVLKAGLKVARSVKDGKAANELSALLDQLS